jgi:hypothetical protein
MRVGGSLPVVSAGPLSAFAPWLVRNFDLGEARGKYDRVLAPEAGHGRDVLNALPVARYAGSFGATRVSPG